ncbi:MAG: hypothetical protein Q9181_005558 [Wetmoreana brouardii]
MVLVMEKPTALSGDQLQLDIFRRRYLQMCDPDPRELEYPPKDIIKAPSSQAWIFENMFNEERNRFLPHARYTYRVLKQLFAILEEAVQDNPEEDEISDDLADCMGRTVVQKTSEEAELIQRKNNVTYTVPSPESDAPTVMIVESPNLLAVGGDTGVRTWAAALFLATFLSTAGRHFVEGKTIIEIGAGLGFISVLCGKHLGAKHVLSTDGSSTVVGLAKSNIALNDVSGVVKAAVLEWGNPHIEEVLQEGGESLHYDLALGADMLYDPSDFPALMRTLKDLFIRNSKLQFLMSYSVRSEGTLETFLDACKDNSFCIERLEITPVPQSEQLGFFHSTWCTFEPLHMYLITQSDDSITT